MTRDEAISILKSASYMSEKTTYGEYKEAVKMAISALEAQGDAISRQAAIEALGFGKELLSRVLDDTDVVGHERKKYEWGLGLIESYIADLEDLPSVQPEIIRCKECKHACLTYRGEVKYCEVWTDDTLYMDGDNFCSFAEREEVEG